MSPNVLALLVFAASVAAVFGGYVVYATRASAAVRRTVDDRLREMMSTVPQDERKTEGLVRTEESGPLPALDRAAKAAFRSTTIDRWIEQSGVNLTVGGLVLVTLASAAGVGMAAYVFSNRWWVGAFAAGIAACIPSVALARRRTVRLRAFEEHFPEALDLLSRAVRAGHALSAGLKMVSDEMRDPVGPEFRKTFDEQNYGLPIKESLGNLALRVPLLDVRFFATAVLIQRESGGNLAEILDNLATVVRERFKIQRQVRVHTAHGRFTGYVLLAIPAFLALALTVLNPDHMDPLFKDSIGQMLIVAGIAMQVVGWMWIKQVVKIEV